MKIILLLQSIHITHEVIQCHLKVDLDPLLANVANPMAATEKT